jgi:transposase
MSNREINEIKYLGIISGISKEIGLVTEIDKLVPRGGKVSVGEATLAMILNGMGLTMSKPIYLVQNYFKGKPLDLLVGKGIESKHLNDDFLGRALDALAEKGLDSIFSKIAFKAVEHYKIQIKNLNGDITNMQLMGEYDDSELVKFGYPKHGRADLKQFLLSLITTDDGAIPLFIKIFQGNTAEPNHYNELLQLLKENLKNLDDSYFTMDCAGFTEKNLKTADGLNIVTRVPDKIVGVKELKKTYMLAPNRLIGEGNMILLPFSIQGEFV